MTRRQNQLRTAYKRVCEFKQNEKASEKTKDIYGGLCHKLAPLIRQNGLCQVVAFVNEKATGKGDRVAAYTRLQDDIAHTLNQGSAAALLQRVQNASSAQYMLDTRLILESWAYYKRFAVSVLGVESGQAAEED